MKILMAIPYIAPVYGGPAKVIKELSQALGLLDITVDIITTNANGSNQLKVPLNQWITEDGFRIQYFNCWHRNDFITSFSLIKWFSRYAENYDIVHTHNIFSPLVSCLRWICVWKNIPYVVTPHGMLEPWALSYKARKKQLYYELLERPSLQRASAIHVLNHTEAQNISALDFKQTVTLPNGVWQQEFRVLPNPEIFYQTFSDTRDKTLILFLGRLDPKKGLDLLAPAFATIHRQFPHTHLIVAGPDSISFLPTAQSYFAQAGCLEAVTFTGMLTGEQKLAALSAADIYIAPSYSEGFSMSVLEGMASGLPCIITTGCNFPEAAMAQAAYVVDTDAEAITSALCQCLSHPEEAGAIGRRARELVFQSYTWEHIAQKLFHIYKTILTQKSSLKDSQSNP